MSVVLKEINMDNFHECLDLKLTEIQKTFVASNMYSLAEAKADSVSQPRAIYHDKTMVGFIMYWFDEENEKGWIDRLMVDVNHQGKGYGRDAMKMVMNILESYEKCKIITTSYEVNNYIAGNLYKSLGFEKTGRTVEGETEVIYKVR